MLPTSLEAATKMMMREDSVAREDKVFGNVFVDHFGGTREHEVKLWNEAVTNWEGRVSPDLHSNCLTVIPVERYIELA
jgi:glutamine synthetase